MIIPSGITPCGVLSNEIPADILEPVRLPKRMTECLLALSLPVIVTGGRQLAWDCCWLQELHCEGLWPDDHTCLGRSQTFPSVSATGRRVRDRDRLLCTNLLLDGWIAVWRDEMQFPSSQFSMVLCGWHASKWQQLALADQNVTGDGFGTVWRRR